MNTSKIKNAKQLKLVMDRMDPLGKNGVLLLQAMSNDGKDDIVKEYAKLFDRIEDEWKRVNFLTKPFGNIEKLH